MPNFNYTLFSIMSANIASGLISISIAALLSYTLLSGLVERMVSFSVGLLLATALLHSLPEAFSSGADTHQLFATLLIGLLGFFVLEKLSLLRHSHHHEGDGHGHHHGHDAEHAGRSGWMILLGDGLHNFTDGILIAAAFLTDPQIGWLTAFAIIAHEIPQEVGDFMVLLNAGFTKTRALFYNLVSSLAAVLGGLLGYLVLDRASPIIPYVLVIASSSFIYIAVSDLMPQMQRRPYWKESAIQMGLVTAGVLTVLLLTAFNHSHG